MVRSRPFFAIALLVGALPLACARAAPEPVFVADHAPFIAAKEDVPLVAPDEPSAYPPSQRLTASKTLGGGDGSASYDLELSRQTGSGPLVTAPSPPMFAPAMLPPRGGGRGGVARRVTSAVTPAGTAAGTSPPVGGNFPAVRSFGPRAAR